MAYSTDPFADLLRQRQLAGPSAPVNRDQLESRGQALKAMGLEGTGMDRLNNSALKLFDAKDAAKSALTSSAMEGILGSGAAAAAM